MADLLAPASPEPVTAVAPPSAPQPAPEAPTPIATAVTPEPAAAAPEPAPAATPEVAPVLPAADAKPEIAAALPAGTETGASASPPTLLEQFDKEQAAKKAADAAKPTDPAAAEKALPVEPVKPEAVDYKYSLPETLKLDETQRTDLHTALDEFRANPVEGAQKLINLHNTAMTAYAEHTAREQVRVFNETRANWAKQVLGDAQIGGAGHQTAMGAIARMRDLSIPEAERAEYDEFLRVTGAGDHPAYLKQLHRFARLFDEPGLPPPNAQPPKSNGRAPRQTGRAALYDNPSSSLNR